ncbi:metallophosphoesterase [Methyloceanibacter sp.]|uniref:metallophosphoesterase family protein n=1 Tax=Methyloceanibacter sp. TaxID=1965321 RepID=UPI00351BAD6A
MARKQTNKREAKKPAEELLIDPRRGDIEADASSTKSQSMLAIAGSMLVEISLPKLIFAWALLLVLPGLLLGLAPIVVAEWVTTITSKLAHVAIGLWSLLFLAGIVALGWFGWRTVFRMAETNFWSLNSIVVQPGYAGFRELIRHILEKLLPKDADPELRANLRAASAAIAGVVVCALALLVLRLARPYTHLYGSIAELKSWTQVGLVALANSVVVITGYLAVAALIWGFADAVMPQPKNLAKFQTAPRDARSWRVAHLSDIHIVGERYGFRIESGRLGPRGNHRLKRLLDQLEALDAKEKFDAILITGDITDAGVASEWAELLDDLAGHPRLAGRVLMLPGNHDVNIVDRANPARMDLPTSPNRRLRQIRCLSAMSVIQGSHVRVVDLENGRLGGTLAELLKKHEDEMARFADKARPRLSNAIPELWSKCFPMIVPPDKLDGLGIILLNSNADTHFSFTNALGMVTAEQMKGVEIACNAYPGACWIIALHHHVIEYPWAAKALSERIGTALINGNWFVRVLQPLTGRAVLMHGHRHVDWIGEIAGIPIVSAPSPVMEVTDEYDTAFYIHTLAIGSDGQLRLLKPERIVVKGEREAAAKPRAAKAG